jgi:hypothetical protein
MIVEQIVSTIQGSLIKPLTSKAVNSLIDNVS